MADDVHYTVVCYTSASGLAEALLLDVATGEHITITGETLEDVAAIAFALTQGGDE